MLGRFPLAVVLWLSLLLGLCRCSEPPVEYREAGVEDGSTEEQSLPDKVGAQIHMTKQERSILQKVECSMCTSIVREMHLEVERHKMTHKGAGSETEVMETSAAICLAMLQNYRLDLAGQKLVRKKSEDEESQLMQSGGQDVMRGMLVLKMGCQAWVDDYGIDAAGYVYKVVKNALQEDAQTAAKAFCSTQLNLCGKAKEDKKKQERRKDKERQKKREELSALEEKAQAKRDEDDPFAQLPDDSKFGLQRMLEMARDDPLAMMDEERKQQVHENRAELRCSVCAAVLEDVRAQVLGKPKSMRREYDILPLVEAACDGGPDLSVPPYFGVEPLPLPPEWTDRLRPGKLKDGKGLTLKPMRKKAAKKRRQWRELARTGHQQPPPPEESEEDLTMTMACKDALEPARMAEAVFQDIKDCEAHPEDAACSSALRVAERTCKTLSGTECPHEKLSFLSKPAGSSAAVSDQGSEL
mmetsp:Transcript_39260/g.92431  ORF Transcript_39260/g.92431 Transcript_39260/m.92431 type:complete len:469 (+) Transcript_39260:110-1516(+)